MSLRQKTLELLEAGPIQAFYVDDRKELVAGASNLGIRAFVYKDTQQLKRDLLDSGVNID